MRFFLNIRVNLLLIAFLLLNSFEVKVRIFSNKKIKDFKIHSKCFFINGKKDNSNIINLIYSKNAIRIISSKEIYEDKRFKISFCEDDFDVYLGKIKRKYYGSLIVYLNKDEILVVNKIDAEKYIESVLENETSFMKNIEAIKANAVVSRTYLLASLGKRHPNEDYDFCDLTHCQLYRGFDKIRGVVKKAVIETKGYIIYYKGKPAWTMYHSVCGGKTEDAYDIWGYDTMPYLKSINDEIRGNKLCSYAWGYRWRTKISKKRIDRIFFKIGLLKADEKLIDIYVQQKSKSGRVKEIAMLTNNKRLFYLRGIDFYHIFGRNINWLAIKSTKFDIKKDDRYFIFDGYGYGHGAGMCQAGAEKMAELGYKWNEIIKHYYSGVDIVKSDF